VRVGWKLLAPLVVVVGAVAFPALPSAASKPNIAPYAGLGTWVDIYAESTWAQPEESVTAMAKLGVRTLYLETGNYRQKTDLVRATGLARFLDAAHGAGIRVVAWYLPGLKDVNLDLRRTLAAIQFVTAAGQRFDSFALDIEASEVTSITRRNARLETLSEAIRRAVGPRYPLGAIIPSAVGMAIHPDYWPHFPYRQLSQTFDVFLPMAYFTYHAHGAAAVRNYVTTSIAVIRAETGGVDPIHAIGGLSEGIGTAEARAFLGAMAACAPLGFSVYEFPTTAASVWPLLRARVAPSGGSCR
jgi:hypothetical protein